MSTVFPIFFCFIRRSTQPLIFPLLPQSAAQTAPSQRGPFPCFGPGRPPSQREVALRSNDEGSFKSIKPPSPAFRERRLMDQFSSGQTEFYSWFAAASSAATASSRSCSRRFRSSRTSGRPVPAGISLPMMTFSFRPASGSTLPLMAASVRTRVVSWKDAADRKDSFARAALVMPSSTC